MKESIIFFAFLALLVVAVVWLVSLVAPVQHNNAVIIKQYEDCKKAGMDAWQGESMNVYCVPPGQKGPQ